MTIPDYMVDGISNYIEHRIPPGSFLAAVICNDLREAVNCADSINVQVIPAYVAYFYNHAPRACWGSPHAYQAWIDGHE